MSIEQKVTTPKANFSKEEEKDLKIGVLLGKHLLDAGGLDFIQKAMDKSSDPAQVIGQFFVQMIQHMQEKMPSDVKLSPRIYLSKNGWLEQMIDYVIEEIHLDHKIADRVEVYVATTAQQLAQAQQPAPGQQGPQDGDGQDAETPQDQQQEAPPQGAPPPTMPQQGGPQ